MKMVFPFSRVYPSPSSSMSIAGFPCFIPGPMEGSSGIPDSSVVAVPDSSVMTSEDATASSGVLYMDCLDITINFYPGDEPVRSADECPCYDAIVFHPISTLEPSR